MEEFPKHVSVPSNRKVSLDIGYLPAAQDARHVYFVKHGIDGVICQSCLQFITPPPPTTTLHYDVTIYSAVETSSPVVHTFAQLPVYAN